jgi:DNA-binding beta-propeller fold protein YncE
MAYLDGAIFVAERTSKMLYKRDAATLAALGEPVLGGGTIWDVDAGAGAIWFTDRGKGELVRVDPATNQAAARIDLGGEASGLAVTDSAVWVTVESTNETLRIDPATNEVVARIATGTQPIWVAATPELAWVTHADGTLVQVDAATSEVVHQVDLGGQPGEPAVAGDAVWVPNQAGGTLSEIGLADGALRQTLTIGPGVAMVVNASGSLWVSGYTDGRLWRIGL